MTSTHRVLATSLALASALICASCTQPSATPAESTTTTATSTPPPTTTTTPPALTPEQQDQKDAEQAVTKLIDVANIVGTNPDETLNQLATVARGKSLAFWRESTFRQRAVKESQTGEIKVTTSGANLENENVGGVKSWVHQHQPVVPPSSRPGRPSPGSGGGVRSARQQPRPGEHRRARLGPVLAITDEVSALSGTGFLQCNPACFVPAR